MRILIGSILFANPALWIGGFALGVPLLIHLLTRRTPRTMRFPTLRFLRAARAHQSRLYNLRHILLLLARTAVLLLILLAFLRPVLMQGAARPQDSRAGRTTILLMDVSASMGYLYAGISPLSQARAAAMNVLDHRSAADKFNLIRMGVTPDISFDEPSDNLFLLKKDIHDTTVTCEYPDINAAITEAVNQLKTATGGRQICLISDFQRTNWASADFSRVGQDIQLLFLPVGQEYAENCAVTDVAIRPGVPTVSENIEIVCKVANYSDRPHRVPLELAFRDGEQFKQELQLDPRSTVSTSFHLRIHKTGQYEGEVVIPEDGLNIDNRRCFVLQLAEKVRVLVVSDEDGSGQDDGTRLLMRAIDPFEKATSTTVVASRIASADLDAAGLASAQVVVLSGVNELSRRASDALLGYLRDGGSVVYFHVGQAGSRNLERLAAWSQGDLVMPFELTGQIDLSQDERYASLAEANFDHAILHKFKESGELSDLKFTRFFSTKRVEQKGQVLLRYDDGNIAMAQTPVGAGMLLLCNFNCSLNHSDVARHTLFVPLIHEIIRGLRPSSGRHNAFFAGHPSYTTIRPVSKTDVVTFKSPAGKSVEGGMDRGRDGTAVFFPKTGECGFYRAYVAEELAGSVAVNVDPLESNLERLDVAQLKELSKGPQTTLFAAADSAAIESLLEGRPLWHYLMIAALIVLCVEQVLTILVRK